MLKKLLVVLLTIMMIFSSTLSNTTTVFAEEDEDVVVENFETDETLEESEVLNDAIIQEEKEIALVEAELDDEVETCFNAFQNEDGSVLLVPVNNENLFNNGDYVQVYADGEFYSYIWSLETNSEGMLYIPSSALLRILVPSGNVEFKAYVNGDLYGSTINDFKGFDLENLSLTCRFVEGDGLYIQPSDSTLTNYMLTQPYLSVYGLDEITGDSYSETIYKTALIGDEIYISEDYFVCPDESLPLTVNLRFESPDNDTLSSNEFNITGLCKDVPTDVSAHFDPKGNLYITSNNKDYLRSIAKSYEYDISSYDLNMSTSRLQKTKVGGYVHIINSGYSVYGTGNGRKDSQGFVWGDVYKKEDAIVEVNNPAYQFFANRTFTNGQEKVIYYDEDLESVIITSRNIKLSEMEVGSYDVEIRSKGYAKTTVSLNFEGYEEQTYISQDAEGNVVITPNETADFFDNIDHVVINDDNTNHWISNRYLDINDGVITIKKELLLANNVPSGRREFYIVQDGNDAWGNPYVLNNLVGCEEFDENAYVAVENGEVRIYSDNKDLLRAIVEPRVFDNRDDYYNNGLLNGLEKARIGFYSTNGGNYSSINNYYSIHGNNNIFKQTKYRISDDEKYVYIISETLKENHISSSSNRMEVEAYGYVTKTFDVDISNLGCENAPEVTISLNANKDIVISSEDKTFLANFTKERVYYSDGTDIYSEGSSIGFGADVGKDRYWYNFENEFVNGRDRHTVIEFDGNNVIIPNSAVLRNSMGNYVYDSSIEVYGYTRINLENVDLRDIAKTIPNDLSVFEDENGNVVIQTTNEDYLSALISSDTYEGQNLSRVEFHRNNTGEWFVNNQWNSSLEKINANTVIISNDEIVNHSIKSTEYEIYVVAKGYGRYTTTITLEHAALDAPADINIQTNSSKDLVITSSDTNYINALVKLEAQISIQNNGFYNSLWFDQHNKDYYKLDDNTIVVPAKSLENIFVTGGIYEITLYAPGYERINNPNQKLEAYVKPSPEVTITESSAGDIEITSSDIDYLKALASPSVYGQDGEISRGGRIWFDYASGLENFREEYNGNVFIRNMFAYDESNKKIVISNNIVLASGIGSKENMRLRAPGYGEITKNITLSKGCKNLEDEVTISFEKGKGIIISCDNQEYLNGIIKTTDRDNLTVSYGGVEVYSQNRGSYFGNETSINEDYTPLYKEGNTVVVDEKYILRNNLLTGEYNVRPRSYGYVSFYDDYKVVYVEGCVEAPKDAVIKYDTLGRLALMSDDKEFLKSFENEESYIMFYNDYNWIQFNGVIDGVQAITYENGNAVLNTALVKSMIPQGEYNVEINSFGYSIVECEDVSVDFNNINKTSVKLGSKLQLSFDSTGNTKWESSDENIVTVSETGIITAKRVGSVIVGATDGESGKVFEVVVKDLTTTDKLVITPSSKVVEVRDQIDLSITINSDEKEAKDFVFASSNENVATVNEEGHVIALSAGSTVISVTPIGSKKTAKYTLTVSIPQALIVDPVVYEDTGTIYNYDTSKETPEIIISAEENIGKTYKILPVSFDKYGELVEGAKYAYTSSDTTIASINSNGLLTIKKAGQFTITTNVSTNLRTNPCASTVIFRVVDYTPILENNKVTVNRYYTQGTDINIYPVYGSTITNVSIDGDYVAVLNKDGKSINIKYTGSAEKTNTSTNVLSVTLSDGTTYNFKLSVQLSFVKPSVKYKVSGTYNKFTTESTLKLAYTLQQNTELSDVNPIVFENNWASIDEEGNVTITDSAVTSGKVTFNFKGYSEGVTYTIRFSTNIKKPTFKADLSSVGIYVPDADAYSPKTITMHIVDANGNKVSTSDGTVSVNGALGSSASFDENGDIKLTIANPGKGGSVVVSYRDKSWAPTSVLNFTVKCKVISSISMSAASVKVNSYFDTEKSINLPISSSTVGVNKVNISKASDTVDYTGVSLVYDESTGKLIAKADSKAAKGTYAYIVGATVEGDIELTPTTVRIVVDNAIPGVTVSKRSLTFNKNYNEVLSNVSKTSSNAFGATVADYEFIEENAVVDFLFDKESQTLYFQPSDNAKNSENGVYKYSLVPVFENGVKGKPIALSITLKDTNPTARPTVKGTLNQLDLSQTVTVRLSLSNVTGSITKANFADSRVKADVDTELNAVVLSLADNGLTDQTIKDNLTVTLDSGAVITTNISIKVARTSPKVKLNPSTVNLYDASARGQLITKVKLEYVGDAEVKSMWSSDSRFYRLELNAETNEIEVYLIDVAGMKAGSNSKFTIKLNWVGDYGEYSLSNNGKGLKTTSLTLNVKDCSAAKAVLR